MPETSLTFRVRNGFNARRLDADLPPSQTVIAAIESEAEILIPPGEIISTVTEPLHAPGAVATFTRESADGFLYRVDAATFWRSVDTVS